MILNVIRQQGAGAGDRLCLKRICENAKVGKVSVEPPAYAAAASTATAASSADSAAHALPTGQPKQTTPATAPSTALIVMPSKPSTRGNRSSGAPGEAAQGAQYDQVDAHDDDKDTNGKEAAKIGVEALHRPEPGHEGAPLLSQPRLGLRVEEEGVMSGKLD